MGGEEREGEGEGEARRTTLPILSLFPSPSNSPGRASTPVGGPMEGVTKAKPPPAFLAAFSAGADRSRGVDASPWNTFLGFDLARMTLASAEGAARRRAAAARKATWRGAVVGSGREGGREGGGEGGG